MTTTTTTVASSASATASTKAAARKLQDSDDDDDGDGDVGEDDLAADVLPWFLGPGPVVPPGVDVEGGWPGVPVPENQDGDGCPADSEGGEVQEVTRDIHKGKRQSEGCAAVPEGYYRSDRYVAA